MAITNINQRYAGEETLLPEDGGERDRRLRHRLELQTGQIKKIFAHNQIPVEVSGGTVQSGTFRFDMRTQLHGGLDRLRNIKDDLVTALGVSEVGLKRENGRMRLKVRKNHNHEIDLLDLHAIAPQADGVSVILGIDDKGQMILLDLADNNLGNILISGTHAAGKSGLMRSIGISLAMANRQSQVQMGIIAAPSRHNGYIARPDLLYPLTYLPHVLFPVVSSLEDSVEALQFLTDEVTYREETGLDWPLLVVLIDNADVLLNSGDYAITTLLTRLANASPAAGLRLILSAAKPDSGELGQILRHNVSLRLTGRIPRVRGQRRAPEASFLAGQGDFLAESYGTTVRFQAAFIDDYDLHLTLEDLHRQQNIVLLAQKQGDDIDEDGEEEQEKARSFTVAGSQGEVILDQAGAGFFADEGLVDHQDDLEDWVGENEEPNGPGEHNHTESINSELGVGALSVVRLNTSGHSQEVSLARRRRKETAYLDFDDDWQPVDEDEGPAASRHLH